MLSGAYRAGRPIWQQWWILEAVTEQYFEMWPGQKNKLGRPESQVELLAHSIGRLGPKSLLYRALSGRAGYRACRAL